MKLLNLGCGNKYVIGPEWDNIDFASNENVKGINILQGLPYADNSVDAVFSSCMLEHFTKEQAELHLKECYRILKPNGICRIVVPDLEDVCKEYLSVLEHVRDDEKYIYKYEYIIIELIDQMTRMVSGGEMQKYWERENTDIEYIRERTGFPEGYEQEKVSIPSRKLHHRICRTIKSYMYRMPRSKNKRMQQLGQFMLSGETHKWMYDSFSLGRLLTKSGFSRVYQTEFNCSNISHWNDYGLEIDHSGKEYKPHSIYMEAVK